MKIEINIQQQGMIGEGQATAKGGNCKERPMFHGQVKSNLDQWWWDKAADNVSNYGTSPIMIQGWWQTWDNGYWYVPR